MRTGRRTHSKVPDGAEPLGGKLVTHRVVVLGPSSEGPAT